jgi:hypothetical protein
MASLTTSSDENDKPSTIRVTSLIPATTSVSTQENATSASTSTESNMTSLTLAESSLVNTTTTTTIHKEINLSSYLANSSITTTKSSIQDTLNSKTSSIPFYFADIIINGTTTSSFTLINISSTSAASSSENSTMRITTSTTQETKTPTIADATITRPSASFKSQSTTITTTATSSTSSLASTTTTAGITQTSNGASLTNISGIPTSQITEMAGINKSTSQTTSFTSFTHNFKYANNNKTKKYANQTIQADTGSTESSIMPAEFTNEIQSLPTMSTAEAGIMETDAKTSETTMAYSNSESTSKTKNHTHGWKKTKTWPDGFTSTTSNSFENGAISVTPEFSDITTLSTNMPSDKTNKNTKTKATIPSTTSGLLSQTDSISSSSVDFNRKTTMVKSTIKSTNEPIATASTFYSSKNNVFSTVSSSKSTLKITDSASNGKNSSNVLKLHNLCLIFHLFCFLNFFVS